MIPKSPPPVRTAIAWVRPTRSFRARGLPGIFSAIARIAASAWRRTGSFAGSRSIRGITGLAKSRSEARIGFFVRSFSPISVSGTQKMSRIVPERSSSKTSRSSVPLTKIPGRSRPVVVLRREGRNEAIGASVATST